jgi:phosphoglycerol transferase MdoB-like AlkP superfamily enzyme
MTALTLSNHEPFDLPDSSVQKYFDNDDSSKIYNSLVYADFSVGNFIRQFKEKPVFDSTIFVFISDHCRIEGSKISVNPMNFHIPFVIYSPLLSIDSGLTIEQYGSQVDFIPTFMSLLGGNYYYQGWGRNLFNQDDNSISFAWFNIWNRLAYLDKDFLYIEEISNYHEFYKNDSGKFILIEDSTAYSDNLEFIQNRLRRLSQSAEELSTPQILFK